MMKFLLRGILKCSDGTPVDCMGRNGTRKYELYGCVHKRRKYQNRLGQNDNCSFTKSMRSDWFEEYIWDVLCNTLFQSHNIKQKVKQELIGKNSSYTIRSINKNNKKLTDEIWKLETNIIDLEKKLYTNQMEQKRFDILSDHINDMIKEKMSIIQSNQLKLDTIRKNSQWIDWIEEHQNRIDQIRNITDYDGRLEIIQHYIHEILVLDYNKDTRQHTLSIKFRFPLYEDKFEWLRNKNGTYKRDRDGRRKFQITDGVMIIENQKTLHQSLNRNTLIGVVFFNKPYLTVNFIVVSHKFNPSPYFTHKHNRKSIHKRINELRSDGLGYRRIHRIMISEGFDIGKSPTCVHTMIKKMDQRERILKQQTLSELDHIKIEIL